MSISNCPFCNGDSFLTKETRNFAYPYSGYTVYISCQNCGAKINESESVIPRKINESARDRTLRINDNIKSAVNEVISKWNRRYHWSDLHGR